METPSSCFGSLSVDSVPDVMSDAACVCEDEANGIEYLHKGISGRNFERTFNLAEHVEVKGATVTDGILRINLERIVPEALKPKTIQIK